MIIKMKQISTLTGDYYDGMWTKDIYLKKGEEIIGLHAVGEKDSTWTQVGVDGTRVEMKGFLQHEQWGNNYDENHNMIGRGSFRIFADIEEVAKELEEDGWVSYEGPTRKEKEEEKV
jgi:hypothetical protein